MDSSSRESGETLRRQVSRRNLLRVSGAGALSVAFFRHTDFTLTAEAKPANGNKRQSVAPFALGLNQTGATIVDPTSIAAGESRLLAEGSRFKVHGLRPTGNPEMLASLDAMSIDVVYAGHPEAPFMAWSYRSKPVPQESVPYSIIIPVGVEGMQLLVSYRLAGASEAVQSTVTLATGTESGAPKLTPGLYLLALPDMNQSLPDWKSHQLLEVTGDDGCVHPCLHEKVRNEFVPSNRPHVLVSIA